MKRKSTAKSHTFKKTSPCLRINASAPMISDSPKTGGIPALVQEERNGK